MLNMIKRLHIIVKVVPIISKVSSIPLLSQSHPLISSTMPQSPDSAKSDTRRPADGQPITLQVGERKFTTTPETLKESEFLAAMLSGRWSAVKIDGVYLIDADRALFEHILRYIRRGVFPLFYDGIKGHELEREADYFGIPTLLAWLKEKIYLVAVSTRYKIDERTGMTWLDERDSSEQLEHHPAFKIVKVYICPRNIDVHRGKPQTCGQACRAARGDGE
jgi:hypothetical protein